MNYKNTEIELNLVLLRLKTIEEAEIKINNEKELLNDYVDKLKNNLNLMKENLKKLDGIENKLYYQIVVKGLNVTKAIDKVAYEEDKDISTIWKIYYPKVKDKIKEDQKILKKF